MQLIILLVLYSNNVDRNMEHFHSQHGKQIFVMYSKLLQRLHSHRPWLISETNSSSNSYNSIFLRDWLISSVCLDPSAVWKYDRNSFLCATGMKRYKWMLKCFGCILPTLFRYAYSASFQINLSWLATLCCWKLYGFCIQTYVTCTKLYSLYWVYSTTQRNFSKLPNSSKRVLLSLNNFCYSR